MIDRIKKLVWRAEVALENRVLMKYLGGHVNLGPLTLYGFNAMHCAANLWVPSIQAYVCFKPPTRVFQCWWPAYFYVSSDATPSSAIFHVGGGPDASGDSARARKRLIRALLLANDEWRSDRVDARAN